MTTSQSMLQRTRSGAAIAVTAALLSLSLLGAACAEQGHGEDGDRMAMGGLHGGALMSHPERMGRTLDHMLEGLNATDAQRSQIKQIALAAGIDLKAQRESGRALHEKAMQLFTAPVVDAGAAEQVRQQMLAQHDQMSKRTLQAMLDASNVLTPEQRTKLGDRMKHRSDTMREKMKRMLGERRDAPKS